MAKKMIRKKKNPDSAGRKALRALVMAVLTLLLTLFLTGFVTGGYFLTNAMRVIGGAPVIDLDQARQEVKQTTQILAYDRSGNPQTYWQLHGDENRVWASLNEMGPSNPQTGSSYPLIADAYVALEDKRFFEHHGVDWRRLASVVTVHTLGSQGASTLTQQLIKNWTGENQVRVVRKYREILWALNLERHYGKDRILEAYLNKLYLGRGCYGVKTGAERYFDKDVSELNLAECASLAAITQNPFKFDPLSNPKKNRKRQKYCLESMLEQGKITQEQYDEAIAFPLEFKQGMTEAEQEQAAQQGVNPYYVDFIIDTVISDLMQQKDMSQREAVSKVYGGGLRIYAAVDLEIQAVAEDVFRRRVTFQNVTKGTAENPVNAAMTVMDYEGRVLAIVGGVGEKTSNRSLNRAAQSWRQPGSTIKPLSVYGPALEKKLITWSSMIENGAFPYKGNMWPHNVDGTFGSYKDVTVQEAVAKSLNTVAARVVNERLKVGEAYRYLDENFGFTHLDPVNDYVLPSMAVGSMRYGFSTLEECAAYASIGNGGVYCAPYCYYRVLDSKGDPLLEHSAEKKQAFSEGTAKVLNELLQTVPMSSYVTAGNDKFMSKHKTFGKTGTTSDNKDRWFAGGTPYYVASVWFGYDIPKDLGQMYSPSAKIWMEVFNRIHAGLDPKADGKEDFPATTKAVQKDYCTRTGNLAGPNCKTAKGWYLANYTPKVCTSCGGGGGGNEPSTETPAVTTTRPPATTNWWAGLFTRPN